MTRRTAIGAAVVAGLWSAAGCVADRASSASQPEDAAAAIKKVVDNFYELARQRDWDAVGALFAPTFRIFSDGAEAFDKPSYITLLKADDIDTRSMTLNEFELFAVPGATMGWCRFRGEFEVTSKGQSSHVGTAETLVFTRGADGVWLIAHAHASVKTAGQSS